jgi:5-aminopentanamidase
MLTVAALQMRTTLDSEANARRLHTAVADAAEAGADLLVTPECALSGYPPGPDTDFARLAALQGELVAHAADAGMHLVLGTTRVEGDRWFNTALLFSQTGELVGKYDKTHLTGGDSALFAAGDSLPVFRLGDWTVAMQICFDMRFAENWRILRGKGAELVLHPTNASRDSGWKVPVLEGAIRSRAADNGMFVVCANDARTPQMMVSAICDPQGRDLARAPENEEALLVAKLDRSKLTREYYEARRTDLWSRPEHRDILLG